MEVINLAILFLLSHAYILKIKMYNILLYFHGHSFMISKDGTLVSFN
jgi:hypothetical protein